MRSLLTAGQVHDVTQAEPLLDGIAAQQVVADKAYDSKQLIDFIHRHTAKNKQFRRIATRYEKLDVRYAAMLTMAIILIWLA